MGVVVERAQADVVDPSFLKGHELSYHLFDLGGIHNSFYRRSIYHIWKYIKSYLKNIKIRNYLNAKLLLLFEMSAFSALNNVNISPKTLHSKHF